MRREARLDILHLAAHCRNVPVTFTLDRAQAPPTRMETLNILKQIADSSAQLSTSALAIFGGTVAAILGTSYRRPLQLGWRLPFLLFVPGWLCLGMVMYLGNVIEGRYLAATMVKQSEWMNIAARINDDYARQRLWLLWSLACFGAWLVGYLLYWVLAAIPEKDSK